VLSVEQLGGEGTLPLSLDLSDAEASEPLNVVKMAKKWLRGFSDILGNAA
jgi:hypothetical protein